MSRRRAWGELLALLAPEVLAVVVLHRLGRVDGLAVPWSSLREWLTGAQPEEVVVATIRMVALAIAWWLLASTVVYLVASASGAPRLARTVACGTLPLARRWTHRALTASVVAGAALGIRPVAAAPPPSTGPSASPAAIVIEIDHRDRAHGVTPTTVMPGRSGRAGGLESAPVVPSPPSPESSTTELVPAPAPEPGAIVATYVVAGGDSLWSIAASHLAQLTSRSAADHDDPETAVYWSLVVETNRARLASGDPNLIFPGEVLDLPPVR
jgi:LysM repeat protein